jgi:integrase
VFAVKAVTARTATTSGATLGTRPRTTIDPRRIREILADAFAPTDPERDPTEFAATSNLYRMALYHLFSTLDQDDPLAVNPLKKVKIRPTKGPQLAGQDMRIVREILKHFPSRFGKSSKISQLRLGVLAWVHITPKQLQQLEPGTAFHDVPDATREDMIAGLITVTKPPRHKGRQRRVPAPETIPLTPYGVQALRAFVAEPAAWGSFSLPPLNKAFKRACTRAQAALATTGVVVDLSAMTVYHLKHSLATTASIASAGLINRQGVIQQSAGVQKALDHAHARTTSIYTQAAVDPILRHVNAATARYLDHLFTVPLAPPPALKIVTK